MAANELKLQIRHKSSHTALYRDGPIVIAPRPASTFTGPEVLLREITLNGVDVSYLRDAQQNAETSSRKDGSPVRVMTTLTT